MFELTQATKAKMLNVIVLSQKNRKPDDNPGAKLAIEITMPASMMAHFASKMPGIFFEAAKVPPKQGQLEGVDPASETPNLTEFGMKVKRLEWDHEMTGYTLEIIYGTGRKESNIKITDSLLSGWKLMPKEGGTVVGRFNLESEDVSEATFGKLSKLKSRDIEITLTPPVVTQQDIERDAIPPAPARKPGAAEKAAVAKLKGGAGPKVPHKGEEVKRTARGAAATKKALAEGAAVASAAPADKHADGAWPFPKDTAGAKEAPPQSVSVEAVKAQKATDAFVASGSQAKH